MKYIKEHNGKIDESAVKFAGNVKLRLAAKEEYGRLV
jgi:hypothetical protein